MVAANLDLYYWLARWEERQFLEKYGDSYRVAWDDGHETTFRPTAGTVHTVHPPESAER